MSNSDKHITITKKEAGLTELPVDTEGWSNAEGIFLQENMITELNADLLPRDLLFLDLTKNPITRVIGTLPPGLISLVLTDTKIEKLGLLPDTLTELVITGTPMATKYGITSDITDKDTIKRLSNIKFRRGTIMVDNTPSERILNNSNTDDKEVNINAIGGGIRPEYSSDDTRHLVMIIDSVEDAKDIKYRVKTLNQGEKLIFKQHLEPYEPLHASDIEPLTLLNPPTVYTKEGHATDILFEQPVPPGCVYITIEECGVSSANWGKLLFAFEDKPAGIRDMLREPVRYKKQLMAHFGRSFHVHYPEAEKKGDRTYIDSIHYPFLAWNSGNCSIGKSGVLSLDDNNVFVDETIASVIPYDKDQVLKVVNCRDITDEDLHKLLDGSKFPTYEMVKGDLASLGEESITYYHLKKVMDRYAFTQSWSFKMFPGIHYNFSCRNTSRHSKTNERIGRRRANSLEGRFNNIDTMTDEEISGPLGFSILVGYVDAEVIPMISKMIQRGVDVNTRTSSGKTLLEESAGKFKDTVVKELVKAPGIDKSGAVEAVQASLVKLIERADNDEERAEFRKNADDIIALIRAPPIEAPAGGSRHRRRKTRVRSRRLRRTRRAKRFK